MDPETRESLQMDDPVDRYGISLDDYQEEFSNIPLLGIDSRGTVIYQWDDETVQEVYPAGEEFDDKRHQMYGEDGLDHVRTTIETYGPWKHVQDTVLTLLDERVDELQFPDKLCVPQSTQRQWTEYKKEEPVKQAVERAEPVENWEDRNVQHPAYAAEAWYDPETDHTFLIETNTVIAALPEHDHLQDPTLFHAIEDQFYAEEQEIAVVADE